MKHMKHAIALLLALCMVCPLLSSCVSSGGETSSVSSGASSAEQSAEPEDILAETSASAEDPDTSQISDEEEEPSAEESTVEESSVEYYLYDYTVQMDVSNVDFDYLSTLDNTSVTYDWNTANLSIYPKNAWPNYYDWSYSDYSGITKFDTDEKVIYLTMDEGYENGCTPEILDILEEKDVSAVFFVTKQFYDSDPDLIQRMIDEGHILGNHTCSHPSDGMPSLGLEAEYEDIKWLNDAVYDTFGYQMKLFRFPTGIASQQSIALVEEMGYTSVFWSFAHFDYDIDNQPDPDKTLEKCINALQPGAIYLLHAVSTANTEILGDFIDQAREAGYEFGVFPVE